MSTAIVWFRRDLRLDDNGALQAALDAHDRIVPLYIDAPDEEAPWAPGAASRWWLHHALAALDRRLAEHGATLHRLRGPSLDALRAVIRASGAVAVHAQRIYEPIAAARDRRVSDALARDGVAMHLASGALLTEPHAVTTGAGTPYRVFTPYWRAARARLQPRTPWTAPARLPSRSIEGSLPLEAFALLPSTRWDAGFDAAWQPGEAGAQQALDDFLGAPLREYAEARDRPDQVGTSRLSPHLHFGEISPNQVAHAVLRSAADLGAGARQAGEAYLRELGWRDFSQYLLHHNPTMADRPLDLRFERFAWVPRDPHAQRRWQRGLTGIPIVDAGMRELWTTGWMHNRVRMLVASFLTKNLRQHWLDGARWFWDTLVDADLANNSQGWQWTAGCGVDAAPYFRIFNPVTQGLKFDPHGHYVRRWIPELASIAAPLVHQPWHDPDLLRRSGYPAPLVDLAETRTAALAAWKSLAG